MTYALGRRVEAADMPAVRAHHPRRGGAELPHQRLRERHRRIRRVPDGEARRVAASATTDDATKPARGSESEAMFITTDSHLSRRTVLKGIGATDRAAVPRRDDAGRGGRRRAASRPVRLIAMEMVHGAAGSTAFGIKKNMWSPAAAGIGLRSEPDQPAIARAVPRLPDHRQQHRRAQRRGVCRVGDRRRSLPLRGGLPHAVEAEADAGLGRLRRHVVRSDLRAEVRRATPIPSMQLCIENVDQAGGCSYNYSCVYTDTISWASPTDPLPMIRDPRAVFDQLFGVGATPEARRARRKDDQSILDWVTESVGDLKRRLGACRSRAAGGLPGRRARDRAAHSEGRAVEPDRRAARAARRAGRRARFVRRARQADVRSAGGGVRRRHDPHLLVQVRPRRVEPRVRAERIDQRVPHRRRITSIATIASPISRRSTPITSAWCRICSRS